MTTFQSVVLIWMTADFLILAVISAIKTAGKKCERDQFLAIRRDEWQSLISHPMPRTTGGSPYV